MFKTRLVLEGRWHAFLIGNKVLLFQMASRMLKESMDKKFGGHWNAVIGESFGNSIGYHQKGLLYMFFGGNLIILVWKNT